MGHLGGNGSKTLLVAIFSTCSALCRYSIKFDNILLQLNQHSIDRAIDRTVEDISSGQPLKNAAKAKNTVARTLNLVALSGGCTPGRSHGSRPAPWSNHGQAVTFFAADPEHSPTTSVTSPGDPTMPCSSLSRRMHSTATNPFPCPCLDSNNGLAKEYLGLNCPRCQCGLWIVGCRRSRVPVWSRHWPAVHGTTGASRRSQCVMRPSPATARCSPSHSCYLVVATTEQ
jgi:hypothetical protein